MDFGSSHVYAGSADTYYSSVPKGAESHNTSVQQPKEALYDPIYESIDRTSIQRDRKSQAKPQIPKKPSVYGSQSLSDKLRKALDEREKQIKTPNPSATAIQNGQAEQLHSVSSGPPLPPRKTLPPGQTTTADKSNSNNEPIYVPRPASKGAPTANIPTLRPPPSSFKRRLPLPPSDTAVTPSQNSDDTPVKAKTASKSLSKPEEEVPWDAIAAPPKAAVPNPYEMNNGKSHQKLYPELPEPDATPVSLDTPSIVPTAPQLTGSLVRRDAEFPQDSVQSPVVVENGNAENFHSAEPNLQTELAVNPMIRASAPHLSQSMIKRDMQRESPTTVKSAPSPESVYSSADTNVVCVKLGIIGETSGSTLCNTPPVLCNSCLASSTNFSEEWVCKFCGTKNLTDCPQVPFESAHDITYVLRHAEQPQAVEDPLVILCIDTSGSMCVTSKIEAASGSLFVSRLQGVQYAIYEQLNRISLSNPNARVALVTFSNIVQVLGDGSAGQQFSLTDMQLYDYDYLHHVGSTVPLPGPISMTRGQLDNAVSNLKESGGTALGPALLISTALASQKPGSQVIVCTDGRANVGIGSLETESDYQLCHHFYNQTAELASKSGVIVSILSIAGTDCRLVELGKVAHKTSGKVSIVEANRISEEFNDILTDTVLATNVSIDLVTHKQLYFSNTEGAVGSTIAQFVGNTTNDSEISFRYGIKREGEFENVSPPTVAPFQLKIIYRPPDGSVRMRVISQMRPVTESREVAEIDMNLGVVGAYASQSAAKLALDGEVGYARQVTNAHKQLLFRGMSLKSQTGSIANPEQEEKIYEHVRSKIDDIGKELAKVEVSSSTEDLSSPEPFPCEVEVYQEFGNSPASPRPANVPPALPPRGRSQSHAPPSGKLTKVQSLESMLARLPSIPKGPIGKKKKNKKKVAEQYRDETAQKMFSFSKATSSRMVGIAE